ncbi:MAG: hypothetical protein JJU11_00095 [Candidatus Sumerlaeia bacterium]|nr:hypothetical protein [Candidatus Sumerlaeia bacterium]
MPAKEYDHKKISEGFQRELDLLFGEHQSGMPAREDSRAFGAMIEKRIADNWVSICDNLGVELLELPGRKTIFVFACRVGGKIIGLDIKTKDLDSSRYSDGAISAVGNLLKFLVNDGGDFLIAEFGHNKSTESNRRDLEYIRVCPFVLLPRDAYRIENLGTGQVRLNHSVDQVWDQIEWDRDINGFYELFTELAIKHYERVGNDAERRKQAIIAFRESKYTGFKLT